MGKIKVGLARNKVALFDQRTNTNFTLQNPVREVSFTKPEQLEDIVRALIANPPSLILYGGEIPEEAKQAVHNRFDTIIRGRSETFKDLSGDIVSVPANNVMDRVDKNITAKEKAVPAASVAPEVEASPMKAAVTPQTVASATQAVEVEAEEEAPKKATRKKTTKADA